MGNVAIFKGSYAKILASLGIEMPNGAYIRAGNVEPSMTPTDGTIGSVYFSSLTHNIYMKEDDGLTTNWHMMNHDEHLSDPTGFINNQTIVESYDKTTGQVSVYNTATPTMVEFLIKGHYYSYPASVGSPWIVPTVLGGAIPATPGGLNGAHGNGRWFLYVNADTLAVTFSTTPWNFTDLMITFVFKNATAEFALRECHNFMGHETHEELHNTLGTYIRTAAVVTTAAVFPSTNTSQAMLAIAATTVYDEDVATVVPATAAAVWNVNTYTSGSYTIAHLTTTAGVVAFYTTAQVPFITNATPGAAATATPIKYSLLTGPNYVLTDVTENSYVNIFSIDLPVTADAESQKYRRIFFTGQRIFTTLAAAQLETPTQVDFGELKTSVTEGYVTSMASYLKDASGGGSVPAAMGNARLGAAPVVFTGTKNSTVGITGASPTDHQALSNRSATGAHPIAAIGDSATDATYVPFASGTGSLTVDPVFNYTTGTGALAATSFNGITALATAEPPSVGSSTSGTVGTGTKVALENHSHDLGSHTHVDATSGGVVRAIRIEVTQANSFAVGDAVYLSGGTYTKAKADIDATSEVVGIVSVASGSAFTMIEPGYMPGFSGLTAGASYFLSAATAGLATATEPNVIGQISKPLFTAISTTEAYVNIMRGSVVGGTNALSQITLANNLATTVQNVSAWDAGELTGFVFIDATTDLRFHIKMQFARVGAGGNYNIAYQTMGDTPPVNFAVAISAGGVISITLPTISLYVTAYIQYSINGPAVGATFPLSINGPQVVGGVPTIDGIKFPAVQVASADVNTLDDYEEGTWTPVDVSIGGPITITQNQSARYTKIGRQVTVTADITWAASGGTSGTLALIGGLPHVGLSTHLVSLTIGYTTYIAGNLRGILDASSISFYDATNGLLNSAMYSKRVLFSITYFT